MTPYNMFEVGQKVWLTEMKTTGVVTKRWWRRIAGHNRAHYEVLLDRKIRPHPGLDFETQASTVVRSGQLRAGDFCCDGCGRWLPNGSKAVSDENITLCFLCAHGAARVLDEEDIKYERAQASDEWEQRHGGGL